MKNKKKEYGGSGGRTTALRNFMYDKKRNKPFGEDIDDLYEARFGSWLKDKWDANKDTIQKYADYASYVPVIGKAAGFVSAGIDTYDAYQAYQAGDMDTYRKERNKALTTAMFSGTPGQYVKGAIKTGIKKATPQLATKTTAHVTKTGIKDGSKELQDTTQENPIIDSSIPTGANVKDPREMASIGIETREILHNQITNQLLNQVENEWTTDLQKDRNNVTGKSSTDYTVDFIENTPEYSSLNNIELPFGSVSVNSPFTHKSYITEGGKSNKDVNDKYIENISINNDISKVKSFKEESDLTMDTLYREDDWSDYNVAQHNDVIRIQKELVNNGYDIGDSDNEIVNRTIEPRYKNKGVDAKFGNKTKKAWFEYQFNKLNIQNKNLMTASYYDKLENSDDVNWKFNIYNSKNKKFNYENARSKEYNQDDKLAYIESIDGIMSPDEYKNTEEILNFLDNSIPELTKDMLVEIDHNWVSNTVLAMIKDKVPVNLDKIDPGVLEYFDIDEININTDPKKLAVLTAYNLINNYSKIKSHLETSQSLSENIEEYQIRDLASFKMGNRYIDQRPDEYTDKEILENQLMTAENLRRLLENETVADRNKILSTDNAQEIIANAKNALSISTGNIDNIANTSNIRNKIKTKGGEIKEPKYTGKYAKYGYQLDKEWAAKKEYENGGDIDSKLEKTLLSKKWIKPREHKHKKFNMASLPTHIILNSLDLKYMKRGGDYPDMGVKIKIYNDYLNGVFDKMDNKEHKKKAHKIVNKLNRFYMYDARDNNQHVFDYMKSQLSNSKNK